MSIRDRAIEILEKSGLSNTDLEKQTGIDRYKWGNLRNKKQRINEEHIEAINLIWPQYAYWLSTGKTIAEAGQISPGIEEKRNSQAR